MEVIFHIDEPEKWPVLLGNVRNLLQYAQDTQTQWYIEVLANGGAVTALKAENARAGGFYPAMEALAQKQVLFAACRNALRGNSIAENTLCPFVRTVPAGVAELAEKQRDGYAYIKP